MGTILDFFHKSSSFLGLHVFVNKINNVIFILRTHLKHLVRYVNKVIYFCLILWVWGMKQSHIRWPYLLHHSQQFCGLEEESHREATRGKKQTNKHLTNTQHGLQSCLSLSGILALILTNLSWNSLSCPEACLQKTNSHKNISWKIISFCIHTYFSECMLLPAGPRSSHTHWLIIVTFITFSTPLLCHAFNF